MRIIVSMLCLFLFTAPALGATSTKGQLFPPSGEVDGSCPEGTSITWKDNGLACEPIPINFSKLNITTKETIFCRWGGAHIITSTCPNGTSLIACAGGPGDQLEDYESWTLAPDYLKNRCIGKATQPACKRNKKNYFPISVIAICNKIN